MRAFTDKTINNTQWNFTSCASDSQTCISTIKTRKHFTFILLWRFVHENSVALKEEEEEEDDYITSILSIMHLHNLDYRKLVRKVDESTLKENKSVFHYIVGEKQKKNF